MQVESRTRKAIINTVAGFVTRIANLIAKFILQTVLIYVLGVQYAGVSGLFSSILTILSLADLGIGSAIAYELYKPLSEGNEKKIAALMNFYKSAYRLVAIIVFFIGIAIIPFLGFFVKEVPDIKENIIIIYLMYIIKTVVSYLLIYKSTLLIANQKNYIVSKIQAIVTLIRTFLECVILLLTKQFICYLLIEIIFNVIQNIWIAYIVEKQYPELNQFKKISLTSNEKKKLFLDVKGLAMYKASFALGTGVDNVIISAFVNTSAVGLISNYTLIRNELEQLLKQFYNAIIPGVGNLSVTASGEKQHKVFSKLLFINFWISCFCSVAYFIIIQPFISLWLGDEFLLSVSIAAIIAFDFYLSCMLETVASFRTANGIFIQGQYRPLIMVVINIILSIVLGKYWGIIGVILATIISRLVTQWYDPYLLYKIVFKKNSREFFLRYYIYMFVFIICLVFTYNIVQVVSVDNLLCELLVRAIVCVVIPNCIIIAIYYKTTEFKECFNQIRKLIKRD